MDRLPPLRPLPPAVAGRHQALLDLVSRLDRRLFPDADEDAEALVVTDVRGRIVACNGPFETLIGYPLAALLGRKPGALLQCPGTDRATVTRIRRALRAKRPIRCELLNRNGVGRLYWTDLSIVPVVGDHSKLLGFAAIQSPISVERASQRLLRRRLLELVETDGGFASYAWDHLSDRLEWGCSADRLLGLDPSELPSTGEAWKAMLHPDDVQRISHHAERLRNGPPGPISDVYRIRHPQRGWLWVRVLTSALAGGSRSTGTLVDISAEASLVRMDAEYRASAELASNLARLGTWVLDPQRREFIRACGYARRILGARQVSVFPLRAFLDQLEPADARKLEGAIETALACGQQFAEIVRSLDQGAGRRWIRLIGRPDWSESGETRLIGAIQDVTSEQGAKQALNVAETRLSRLVDAWPDTILVVDHNETVRDLQKRSELHHPFRSAVTVGSTLKDLLPPDAYWRVLDALTRSRLTASPASTEVAIPGEAGQPLCFEARAIRMDDHDTLLIFRDISRRRQAEQESAQRLALYQHLAESQPQGLIRMDSAGRVVYANTAFRRLVGADRMPAGSEEPCRLALQSALGSQSQQLFELVEEALRDGASRVWESQTADERILEFQLHPEDAAATESGRAPGLLALARDVTEERQREQRLEMQRSLFSALHQIATQLLTGSSRSDLLGSIVSHTSSLLGAAHCHIGLLVDASELELVAATGAGPLRIGDRADATIATVAFRCLTEKRPVIIEDYSSYPARRPDVPLDAFRAVMEVPILLGESGMGTLGIAHSQPHRHFSEDDISAATTMARFAAIAFQHQELVEQSLRALAQRQQAEAAREDDQSLLRLLDESLQDVVFFRLIGVDGEQHFETISAGIARVSGLEPEQIIEDSRRLWARLDDESQKRLRGLIEGDLQPGTRIDTHIGICDAAGDTHWCRIIVAVRLDSLGRSIREGLLIDLSRERELQLKHEALIARLRDANAELSRFNYSVAHDLRNPVVAVMGMAQLLERELQRGQMESATRRLHAIMRSAQNMAALLDDLLQLAKIGAQAIRKRRLKIADLISRVQETLASSIEALQGQVHVDVPAGLEAEVDPGLLSAVLVNLLSNALKFTRKGERPWVAISARNLPQGVLEIRVQDRGIGIEPQHQQRVFQLFERLNPSIEGSGVGLTIVQRCVELHGGTVQLESIPNQGCCFTIRIPQPQ